MKRKKKTAIAVILLGVLFTGGVFAYNPLDVDCNGTVNIVDALMVALYYVGAESNLGLCGEMIEGLPTRLESEVRNRMGIPERPIYTSDVENIRSLRLMNSLGVAGIEYFTALEMANISDTKVKDLTPFSQLSNLSFLRIFLGGIEDVSPLAGLDNLTHLILTYNKITDISPLEGLPALTTLDISKNEIVDIDVLLTLPALEIVNIAGNPLKYPGASYVIEALRARDVTVVETLEVIY